MPKENLKSQEIDNKWEWERKTKFWFNIELEKVKIEHSEERRLYEIYLSMGLLKLYGLSIYLVSIFIALIGLISGIEESIDWVTLTATIFSIIFLIFHWRYTFKFYQGYHGIMNYQADKVDLLDESRNQGILID